MSNLLMVDFDYFFRNALESGDVKDPAIWLYDWGHQEGSWLHDQLWPIRASGFIRQGWDLPQVEIPDGWWDRFNITDDAICEVSDSNMYSAIAGGNRRFDHVWLFDAHHDLYRIKTVEQLEQWADENKVTCENWMFAHYIMGSKLHWRWPKWHNAAKAMRNEVPKWVGLDARRDDLGKFDDRMEFDVVSICRSGSWVPPWCDEQFKAFYESCPAEIRIVDDTVTSGFPIRSWDMAEAQRQAEMVRKMEAQVEAEGGHMLNMADLRDAQQLVEEVSE